MGFVKLFETKQKNDENANPIPIENFVATIDGWDHSRAGQRDPKIEGNHLNENWNMNSKNHTVLESALMQKVWNDPSQATQAKELCAEAAKLRRTMTRTNPDRTSQAKK